MADLSTGPAADIKTTTSDLRGQVGRIQNQVKEIQEVVRMYSSTTGPRRVRRQKVDVMSAEVSESNPYSRLMALKSMGVVKNFDRVRDFSVAVVGIGGVGVGVVEMLTRCGVGKIIIYDYDTIELANMNKMFYRPEQSGWNKTMACRHYCSELNPDVVFEVHNMDITAAENRAKFKDTVATGSVDRKEKVSLLVGCVDNMEARGFLETVSEDLQLPFMDAVVADDAMSGHVQLIIPGRTGGLEAAPIKTHMDKRSGTCPASLATTDSIISGLAAQNVLKYLLGFGEVFFLMSYNALTNEFQSRMTYPDPRKMPPGGGATD
uniref:Ubiquitin-like modifier-activating enzyme 5 n=1 Tax=Haptolina ericina TaxID=156174 RepID=A0A7S3EST2_9EUKA|mmetsp:Transcript_16492/g.36931  ORF Transcript_16492/g.36931 Transcript_16492/m.36931 type:complete len:320 (+) Transcript_16492:32-991(+)